MWYAISTSDFRVHKYETMNEMLEDLDPTAFMRFHGVEEAEFEWVCSPSLKQLQVLELAIELGTELTLYYAEQLVDMGATIYSGSVADRARIEGDQACSYSCLKSGLFVKAKDHLRMLNAVLDLPKLSELCSQEGGSEFVIFHRLICAMEDFLTPGRIPEPYVPSGDDSDIPF